MKILLQAWVNQNFKKPPPYHGLCHITSVVNTYVTVYYSHTLYEPVNAVLDLASLKKLHSTGILVNSMNVPAN